MARTALYTVIVHGGKLRQPMRLPSTDQSIAVDTYMALSRKGFNCEMEPGGIKIFHSVEEATKTVELFAS